MDRVLYLCRSVRVFTELCSVTGASCSAARIHHRAWRGCGKGLAVCVVNPRGMDKLLPQNFENNFTLIFISDTAFQECCLTVVGDVHIMEVLYRLI